MLAINLLVIFNKTLAVEPLNLFSQNVDTNCPFQFQKRSQLFIGTHNETLPVAAIARQQSRLFARRNQRLRPSLSSIRLC